MSSPAPSRFISHGLASRIAAAFGTPAYVYDLGELRRAAADALAFPNAFGLTVRYAMKASPNAAFLRIFSDMGLCVDASSGYEARRAMEAGIKPADISLSAQELPGDVEELARAGVKLNACSLAQLRRIGELLPGHEIGLRFNPGAGSGGNNRTNVGGPSSSFGIWHEWADEVRGILGHHRLRATRIHSHIGSGSDPEVWLRVSNLSLELVRAFPEVTTLNLGGGYKVARMPDETGTDLGLIGQPVAESFRRFREETGRAIHLEVEPGTYLVANAGAVLATVRDVVSTGNGGYEFIKLDTGMTELLRPSLYGSQHPVTILAAEPRGEPRPFVVVGHCCESGDILTPAPGDPELLAPRLLPPPVPGDFCVIDGAGAYAAGMAAKNYNSFPEAPEVLVDASGRPHLIRRRQEPGQIWANELPFEG